jgi:DNA polymerase-1
MMGVDRQTGKMIMLASIYGAGPKTLKRQCIAFAYKFDMAEMVPDLLSYDWEDLYRRFHRAYAIKDLARLTELQARRRRMVGEAYIRTLGGRRQRPKFVLLPPVNGYRQRIEIYKDLGNSLVQGSSADLMKQALIEVDEAGYGDYLRLTVHDEMVAEVPDEKVQAYSEAVTRIMTRNEFVPPLTIGIGHAERYGQAK